MDPAKLSSLASAYEGIELVGPDCEITAFGTISSGTDHRDRALTYAVSSRYVGEFLESDLAACVMPRALARDLPPAVSALLTEADPAEIFYAIFSDTVTEGRWERLPSRRGSGNTIAASAQIHDHVVIGDNSVIMDYAVLLPNTRLGNDVLVKPHATIGGQGFQLRTFQGRRSLAPHAGGVFIDDNAAIGSQTCIDCGLFGDFTTIGSQTIVDNLVHIAHSAQIGANATIVACAEVSGSVRIGDGAWLGPRSCTNPGLNIGHDALIGTGSTVVKDIPPHAVAYGAPARVAGWRCVCGTRLPDGKPESVCPSCGTRYEMTGPHPSRSDAR